MLTGTGAITAGGQKYRFPTQAFATVQENVAFTVVSEGATPAGIVKVIAPPRAHTTVRA